MKTKTETKQKKEHQTSIFEYIRRRHHGKTHKVGVILGIFDGKAVKIGWSKCNVRIGDKFDKQVGLKLALNRALNRALPSPLPKKITVPTPDCIRHQIRNFGARCAKYFKGANKILIPA